MKQAVLAIFSAYRRDDYADPATFMVEAGAVLEQYPDEIIGFVSSPKTGIQRRVQFAPTIAELVKACDEAATHFDRMKRYSELPKFQRISYTRPEREQGRRANIHVLKDAPQYASLVELSATLPIEDWRMDDRGIWISLHHFAGPRLSPPARPIGEFAPAIEIGPELQQYLKDRDNARRKEEREEKHWSEP